MPPLKIELMRPVKDPLGLNAPGVYNIPCLYAISDKRGEWWLSEKWNMSVICAWET